MQGSTYLNWFRRLLVLGAVVAGLTAQAAGAIVRPPDVQDRADALNTTTLGLKADGLRLQGIAQVYQQLQFAPTSQGMKADGMRLQGIAQAYQQLQPVVPDVFERYAANHPFGTGLSSAKDTVSRPPDVQDAASGSSVAVPDVIERYATSHPYGSGLSSQDVSVPRPPDVTDAALTAQYGSSGESTSGFNWGDWAIGIGSGIGMALLLGAGLVTSRQVRQRVRTA